jgi:signal transduction histidine kinase
MKSISLKKLSLQQKFIILAFSTVIIFMFIVGYLVTKRNNSIIYNDIERQGKILAETLAIPVMNDLIYERLGLVEEGGLIDNYITGIFNENVVDLVYITVLDPNGRVISHNDFSEYGLVYDDPITIKALASDKTVVQKFHAMDTGSGALDFATPLMIGKKRWGTLKFAISLRMLEKEMQSTIYGVVGITVLMLAIGFSFIFLLSRRFIKPISELAEIMEQAKGDQLEVQVSTRKGSDEIARLGQSFNQMIRRIRQSNLKLQNTHDKLLQFVGIIERAGGDTLDVKVDIKGSKEIGLLCQSFNQMIDRIRQSNLELKTSHEKLFHAEKLASLGILAAGVAHEINNPLGGLFNCVNMLDDMGEDKEFRQRYLILLKDGLSSIENTVGKLLWISSKGEKTPQDLDVKQAVSDAFGLIEYKLRKSNISFEENIEDGLTVRLDPNDLQQALINLMINAMQSMTEPGTLTIDAYCKESKVILEVTDTGEGIAEKDIPKIFDPFFTTKQPGEGTGLGLWLTYEIVKSYGGEISVTSRKTVGTTFLIKFDSTCKAT